MPRISVIIPVYNAAAWFTRAVESVFAQTYTDWELLLADDGSTDDSPTLCDTLQARDARVRVLHLPHGGVSKTRNAALDEARGSLIAFVDADDWLEPDALETMITALDFAAVSTVACGNTLDWPDGRSEKEAPPLPAGTYPPVLAQLGIAVPLLNDRLSAHCINGYIWRYLFSRRIIEENRIRFSGAYLEDELFLIEYFSCGADLTVTDDPLYHYYQNPGSVTKRYLPGYVQTFFSSLQIKDDLVEKYNIQAGDGWVANTCWAGLLIAVSNIFAPGNNASFREKLRMLKALPDEDMFDYALRSLRPMGLPGNKQIVAELMRRRLYLPLAILYTAKNRGRT